MNIIVVGCGKVGTSIAASLVAEGHDVTVLDKDADVIESITNVYDVFGLNGNGADVETLQEAGVEKAELVVSATGSDELNMLTCFLAKRLGASHTIARIRNPEYNDKSLGFMKDQLELSMAINPESLAANEMYSILKFPSAIKIETFSRGNFEMIEIRLKANSELDGVKLCDLRSKYHAQLLVCAVQRGEEVFIPDGNFVLKSGDKIGITASPAEITKFMRKLSIIQKKARSIMIIGGSRTAYYLAKALLSAGNDVKIVEQDIARCNELGEALSDKAVILNNDGAQQDFLIEQGLRSVDAFVSLTGMDEENILLSYFALCNDVPKVIAKVNREEFVHTAHRLGLECVVSPKDIVSDVVVRYARALQNSLGSKVEALYKLMDGEAEALEFNVSGDFKHVDTPLKNLSLKPNTLIAGIIRDRKPIIPSGDDTIQAGDSVVVITSGRILGDLSDIIA